MVFKSDKQRKKVMAMLKGGTKSAVNPQVVGRIKLKPTVKFVRLPITKKEKAALINFLATSDNVTTGKFDKKLAKKIDEGRLLAEDVDELRDRVVELFEDSTEFSNNNPYLGHGGSLTSEDTFSLQKDLEDARFKLEDFQTKIEDRQLNK